MGKIVRRKDRVVNAMRVDAYAVMRHCLNDGIPSGIHRWLRKGDAPKAGLTDAQIESLHDILDQYIMNSICEYFTFNDTNEGV